jgi:hypothetical protein
MLMACTSYEYCHGAMFFMIKFGLMSKYEISDRRLKGHISPQSGEVLSMLKINQKYYRLIHVNVQEIQLFITKTCHG